MASIPRKLMFTGNLYRCTSYTVDSTRTKALYKEEIVGRDLVLIKVREGVYAEIENLKKYGDEGVRYRTKPRAVEDYYVKDLVPYVAKKEQSL